MNRNPNLDKALKLCRGSFQRSLVMGLETLGGSTLKGKAKSYATRYQASGHNLMARLEKAGVPYHVELGPRGGYHSARLIID